VAHALLRNATQFFFIRLQQAAGWANGSPILKASVGTSADAARMECVRHNDFNILRGLTEG